MEKNHQKRTGREIDKKIYVVLQNGLINKE